MHEFRNFNHGLKNGTRWAFFVAGKKSPETGGQALLFALPRAIEAMDEKIRELTPRQSVKDVLTSPEEAQKLTTLKERRAEAQKALDALQAPVRNGEDVKATLSKMEEFDLLLGRLQAGDIGAPDLQDLLSSELKPFVATTDQAAFTETADDFARADKIKTMLFGELEFNPFTQEAKREWQALKKHYTQKLKETTDPQEKSAIENELKLEAERIKAISLRKQVEAEWEDEKRRIQAQIENLNSRKGKKPQPGQIPYDARTVALLKKALRDRQKWIDEEVIKRSKQSALKPSNVLPANLQDKAVTMIEEARFMRLEKIREYLKGRLSDLIKRFEALQKNPKTALPKTQAAELTDFYFRRFSQHLESEAVSVEELRAMEAGIANAERELGLSAKKLEALSASPETLQAKWKELSEKLTQLTPEKLEAIRQKAPQGQTAVENGLHLAIAFVEDLKKPGTESAKMLQEVALQMSTVAKLGSAELEDIDSTIRSLLDKVKKLDSLDESLAEPNAIATHKKARKAISRLEALTSLDEIKKTLSEWFSPNEIVWMQSHHEFTEKYGAHTESGHMVFEKTGDAWQIFIDETGLKIDILKAILTESKNKLEDILVAAGHGELFVALKSVEFDWTAIDESMIQAVSINTLTPHAGAVGARLTREVIHELRHVEFDHHAELRQEFTDFYLNHPEWTNIKDTFVKAFPQKSPPHLQGVYGPFTAKDWRDEDVINELYAMNADLVKAAEQGGGAEGLNYLAGALAPYGVLQQAANINSEKYDPIEDGQTVERLTRGAETAGSTGTETSEAQAANEENLEVVSEADMRSAEEMKKEVEALEGRMKDILQTEYLSYMPGVGGLLSAMMDYNRGTGRLTDQYQKSGGSFLSGIISDRLKKVEKDLKAIEAQLSRVSEGLPNQKLSFARDIWNRTTLMSLDDIFQVVIDVKEFYQRRHKRKQADHAARIGMSLFQGTDLGHEARARQLKAEAEEVNEWQNRYDNLDAWQLLERVKMLADSIDPSKDQLKAILRILAKKGRIDWRQPELWKVLNKVQGSVHFTPGDPILLHNPGLLHQKLHSALGEIYDYDEFLSLERQNESAYESEKKKYNPSLDRIQDQLGGELDHMLAMHRANKQVDPQRYEAILEYCIENGKSVPDNIFFHIMAGTAAGLLAPDRGMALDKHLNKYPATQWIYSKKPPLSQKDYERYCLQYFKDDYLAGSINASKGHGAQFRNFFWTQVQNDNMTIDRVRKSVVQRVWDHDWCRAIAPLGDANTMRQFLSGRSGQQEAFDTAVQNAYVGMAEWLEENSRNPNRVGSPAQFARQIAALAMADGIIDKVAYRKNDIYVRKNASMLSRPPREDVRGWTTQQYRDHLKGFLYQFDPAFFSLISDEIKAQKSDKGEELAQEIRKHLETRYPGIGIAAKIKVLDDVFGNMDAIVMGIVNTKVADGSFYKIIEGFRNQVGPLK